MKVIVWSLQKSNTWDGLIESFSVHGSAEEAKTEAGWLDSQWMEKDGSFYVWSDKYDWSVSPHWIEIEIP